MGAPLGLAASPGHGRLLELARLALTVLALGPAACGERPARPAALAIPGEAGPRITVEVLNATGKDGLAKAGTRLLRRAGIDVVTFGNAPAELAALDSTRIVVLRAGAGIGDRVRRELGVGKVVVQLDSTRLLDASVLLGADFTPRLDFHP